MRVDPVFGRDLRIFFCLSRQTTEPGISKAKKIKGVTVKVRTTVFKEEKKN
jgi:hypothetical protein